MKRFTKLARSIFIKTSQETTDMSSRRYFLNPLLETELKEVAVPEQKLKRKVQDILEKICHNFTPNKFNAEDGLYLGTAGISYMFYHISKIPAFSDQKNVLLNHGLEYLKPALEVAAECAKRTKDEPAFILGNSGIYAIAAVLFNITGNEKKSMHYKNLFDKAGSIVKKMQFLDCGSDELFVGRAGYLCGAIWLAKALNAPVPVQDLYVICGVIVASGRDYSQRHRSPSPLMYAYYKTEYLGAAHGLCSILQMLLTVPGFLDTHPSDAQLIKQSVDYLLSLQDSEGNFPAAMDEVHQSRNEFVHWCHGAPGVIYLMAKAYITWRDEKYLNSCSKMAETVWKRGLLRKGPGICHGIAGNGYVFLLMYRLTNDPKYLHQAVVFAEFLDSDKFKREARTPDHPYSLYEGLAGTACFLGDLTNPMAAVFPFSDVF